ncbi:MAG: winged helix-turn-helix transcriptional regulator [Anaerolineaceae bacterium]|jgi:predicted ArsR family transcriptional regulator|nr:winged helix-turn-helix transcriptional regulator [Anaerolineaceae bacterium]
MKSTKDKILLFLLKNPKSTINDLADAVTINAISVRHHLNNLLADGLVLSEEERHGVGRPRLVYSLSDEGLERFPSRYYRLTNRILDRFKDTLSPDALKSIFSEIAKDIASSHRQTIKNLSLEDRLNFVQELLDEEGFNVEWEKKNDHYLIHEISCPYFQVAQSHPEVCTLDQTLITELLDIPASKMQCILRGDQRCSFLIPLKNQSETIA